MMAERSFPQLPISSSQIGKRMLNARRGIFPASERWIHVIPVIVFFCFFILWWFSHPVTVEIKNGIIMAIHRLKKSPRVSAARNETLVDIAILASSAMSPTADSLPGNRNLTLHNSTEPVKAKQVTSKP